MAGKKKADSSMSPEDKFLRKVMKRLKRAVDADKHNRTQAIEDLKFLNGDQWDPAEKRRRSDKGRPALMINLLPKFVDQVVGDERHNRPRVEVRPNSSKASIDMAKIRQGLISNIEYNSNGAMIYDEAFESMVSCGYGAWRVHTRYCEDNPFVQEIYMEGIENPFMVYMDPEAKCPVYSDAKWGFILDKMPEDDFEDEYPDAGKPSEGMKIGEGLGSENWFVDGTVTVAEYFEKCTEKVKMVQLENGDVMTEKEAKELIKEWDEEHKAVVAEIEAGYMGEPDAQPMPQPAAPQQPSRAPGGGPIVGQPQMPGAPQAAPPGAMKPPVQPGQPQGQPGQPPMAPPSPSMSAPGGPQTPPSPRPKIVKERDAEVTKIKHWLVTASDIIDGDVDGNDVPGKFVPIVLLTGKRRNIEGKRHVRGLVRDAKDPQKLINYWNTNAAETIALAPKAPWIGTAKQFEGYEDDYAQANIENYAYLKYNSDDAAPGPPQRVQPPQPPQAIFMQIASAQDNLKSVLGMYGGDVGEVGPERTGAAVTNKQKPGDIATFTFHDNLSRAVGHNGRIINEMIPEIYDTERDIRLRNIDDTEAFVPVNTTAGNALKIMKQNPERYRKEDAMRLMEAIKKFGADAKFNELTIGKYNVVIKSGPSYATARQESSSQLMMMVQAMPQQMALAADIIVENMDFKDAEKLAKRLKKALPPGILEVNPGDPPPQQPPPSPQVQIQQQKVAMEQEKVKLAQEKVKMEQVKIELEKTKLTNELASSKQSTRATILEILQELHSPQPQQGGMPR